MKKINTEGLDLYDIDEENVKQTKKYFRVSELELPEKVYLTQEAYQLLRKQKRIQKKSMAKITCDLIEREFKS
ncbi:MAG: hypothetical protein K9M44_04180 [Candidatus Pacebacteria bacterium]|jgi:hypothetical protein|nr:hypothetical protein [Candidatus Paceibacterota bacterium]